MTFRSEGFNAFSPNIGSIVISNHNLALVRTIVFFLFTSRISIFFLHRHRRYPQALVSFKKYMPPPLPYFKVNICPFPLPHFASIFFAYLRSFRWPNYIVTLPRYFSFRLPHLNIPPQTNWTRIFSERRMVYFSVIETDTATSGPV